MLRTQALDSYPQHCHPSVRSERVKTKNNWFCGAGDLLSLFFMREFDYFVYSMASRSRVLYTGVTNNLSRRVFEHKTDRIEGFTKRYRVHRLVYFESYNYVKDAIKREKEIKRWVRQRRVELIESMNPTWEDLAADWFTPQRLAAGPDTLVYDPSLIQTFANPLRAEFRAPNRLPEKKTRMRFQPSKVQSFGMTTSSKRGENKN